jgi:raffinose/stachyose/melibiose transport system substrate-binding protein
MHRFFTRHLPGPVVLAAAACALMLAACGSSSKGGSSSSGPMFPTGREFPKGPVHLTVWWWGDQEAHGAKDWLAQSVAAYQRLHANVTISTVLQTTDGLVPAFNTAAAAGKGPDIQYLWGGINTLEPAWKGYIRPVSDYVPASELAHYVNAKEDTYQGKLWSVPWYIQPSFPVLYRKDILQKAGVQPPATWQQLLAACDTLNAKGITPITGGLKDGFFAGWLYSMLGGQSVSAADVLAAVNGQQKFDDAKQSAWWQRLAELRQHKCFNNDINSLQLYQGQQRWSNGQAAMTVTAGSDVRKFVQSVGVSKAGLMSIPVWANGPYAGKLGSTSQTLSITKTTKYPQVAASFLEFLHTAEPMNSFYKTTGAIPADDRFDGSQITMPQLKQVFDATRQFSAYLENFIPTQLDSDAIFNQAQLVLGGNATPQKAAAATEQLARRLRLTQPGETADFGKWAQTYR